LKRTRVVKIVNPVQAYSLGPAWELLGSVRFRITSPARWKQRETKKRSPT
jgi:hypothetical protein